MFLFTKDERLAFNEEKEYDHLKKMILEITEPYGQRTRHRLFEDWDDAIKLGVTFWDSRLELQFWVEVRSHVPYFGDDSKDLEIEEIIEEMKKIDENISDYIKEKQMTEDDLLKSMGVL